MSDRDDIDALAAEYVLGTLDAGERASVALRRRGDAALETAIGDWERRLGPLAEAMPSTMPPEDLLARLEARLDEQSARALGAPSAEVMTLESRVRRWRTVAGISSIAAASLLALVGVREMTRPASVQTFFGVFTKDDAAPSFVITVDLAAKTLILKTVGAPELPDKNYQLWIKTTPQAAPRSLGVVAAAEFKVGRELAVFRTDEVKGATFGVSLEPRGGSPTGQPTGPVLHAQLLPGGP